MSKNHTTTVNFFYNIKKHKKLKILIYNKVTTLARLLTRKGEKEKRLKGEKEKKLHLYTFTPLNFEL